MKYTELQAMEIAEEYKKIYPSLTNEIIKAQYNEKFDVIGEKAWIVTGEFEQFGEIQKFFYVISDESGKVEYTFNEHGTRNPHLR